MPDPDRDLERMLVDTGEHLEWPPEEDLAPTVLARIQAAQQPRPRRWVTALATAAVVPAVLAGILMVSPTAREWITGGDGDTADTTATAEVQETEPPAVAMDVREEAAPAEEPVVPTDEARAATQFSIVSPALPDIGPPDDEFHSEDGGELSLVWQASDELPAPAGTDAGLVLTQSYEPMAAFVDRVFAEAAVEDVFVLGRPALWIEDVAIRVAGYDEADITGNVLLWEEDGITYRLVSALGREQAVNLAESLRPVEP